MANDNAIEFTETRYTSRKEMGNELRIVVPDEMWRKVVDYRSTFNSPLSLKDIGGRNLNLCLYPTLASKTNQIESKLVKLLNDYSKLDEVNGNKQHCLLTFEAKCLESLAKISNMDVDAQRLKRVIISENPFDENEERLLNYHSAFEFIKAKYASKIDVDFLAELYSRVSGISELTYFYRDSDINDASSMAMVGRAYTKAPARLIETMMDSLFNFIETSSLSNLNKAIITYYYILYVWPFKNYNQEIAFLMAKAIFAHNSLWELGVSLPFERFALEKDTVVNRMFGEVRNSADVTYAVSPLTSVFEQAIDELLLVVKDYTATEVRNDFYKEDEVKDEIKEEKSEPTPTVIEEKIVEEKKEPNEVSTKVEEKEKIKEEVPVINKLPEVENEKVELAVSYIPREIDEKDARRLENHLLELDVRLKKGEAYFYARHCTIGMYYTIEQYRKALKCVYETARTSMDHLAELGYYKKTKYGKKFVYTPIKRK